MARKLSHSLIVEGELVANTPVHVGGAVTNGVSNMSLAVDGKDRFYLPGTSLGGAIRAYCGAKTQDEHWGYALSDDRGTASRIVIDDATAIDSPIAELWHGNGIDRYSGTAAQAIKYDQEVLPKGTRFHFRMCLEVGIAEDVNTRRGWLGQLVLALEAGRIPIGAGSTRGFGRMHLVATQCHEQHWCTPEGILALLDSADRLNSRDAWTKLAENSEAFASRDQVRITIHWQPDGPLMSKAAREGIVVDSVPFVSQNEQDDLALTLPGAGIKGALRSHAERIIRTITDAHWDKNAPHFEQVDVSLVGDLFGRAKPSGSSDVSATPDRRKGRLAIETCYANFALKADDWDRRESEEKCWQPSDAGGAPFTRAMHVAVDRWTGGAAEGLLFSTVEPGDIDWQPIVLQFEAGSEDALIEFALLWLILKDFCARQIPLGYAVNRGYGSVRVNKLVIEGLGGLSDTHDMASNDLLVTEGAIDSQSIEAVLMQCECAWQQWVNDEQEVCS